MINNIILSDSLSSGWAMYALVAVLLIGNIAFIILFILSVVRNNKLEEDMRDDLLNKIDSKYKTNIEKTAFDKERRNPIDAQPKLYGATKYKLEESKNKDGWYIKENGKEEKIAFAKTKEEAQEIIKNLCR